VGEPSPELTVCDDVGTIDGVREGVSEGESLGKTPALAMLLGVDDGTTEGTSDGGNVPAFTMILGGAVGEDVGVWLEGLPLGESEGESEMIALGGLVGATWLPAVGALCELVGGMDGATVVDTDGE
jgi:hypothetical protein